MKLIESSFLASLLTDHCNFTQKHQPLWKGSFVNYFCSEFILVQPRWFCRIPRGNHMQRRLEVVNDASTTKYSS